MNVTLLDTHTGERRKCDESWEASIFWWSEGNGACDCNRAIAFLGSMDAFFRSGVECGCERFLVVDVAGDLEGMTPADAIQEANHEYPDELVARHLGALT